MKKQKILDWIRENTKTVKFTKEEGKEPEMVKVVNRDKLLGFINDQQEYRGII
jgi:hypothetical protein